MGRTSVKMDMIMSNAPTLLRPEVEKILSMFRKSLACLIFQNETGTFNIIIKIFLRKYKHLRTTLVYFGLLLI